MNPTDLDDCEQSHEFLLSHAIASIRQGQGADAPYFTAEVANRILGICALLGRADVPLFLERLDRSGTARLRLLELNATGLKCDPQVMVASKALGFAAALASGNLRLAAGIARLLPAAHAPTWEYEDDFLFFDFLRHATLGLADGRITWKSSAEGTLRRWQAIVAARDVPAFDMCRALLVTDGNIFATAFDRFIRRRVEQLKKHQSNPAFNAKVFAAEGHIFVEGFAVLEIATSLGFPAESDYPLLPSLGRAMRSKRQGPSPDWLSS